MTLPPCSLAKPNSQSRAQTSITVRGERPPAGSPVSRRDFAAWAQLHSSLGPPPYPSTTGTGRRLSTPLAWPPGGWGATPHSDSSITSPTAPRSAPRHSLSKHSPGTPSPSRLQTPCLGCGPSGPPSSPSVFLALSLPGCLSPYPSPSISVSSPGRLSAADASQEWRC